MVKIGNKVVYRDEVCVLVDIAKEYRDGEDYYILQSSEDPSLSIKAPVRIAADFIRKPITKSEIDELIEKIPAIMPIELEKGSRGAEYKDLLESGSHEDVVKVIKTAYLRRHQLKGTYRPNEKDKMYFRQAEKRLYGEIACVLDVSLEEAKRSIVSRVKAVIQNAAPSATA